MPSDITWNQLNTDIALANAISISGGEISIKVNAITGDTYTSLDNAGVVKFAQKLLDFCNKTQTRINTNEPAGNRPAAFPTPTLATPTKGSDNIFRTTYTQQVASRLTVDSSQVTGLTN